MVSKRNRPFNCGAMKWWRKDLSSMDESSEGYLGTYILH